MMESRFQDEALKRRQQHDADVKKVQCIASITAPVCLQIVLLCCSDDFFQEFWALMFLNHPLVATLLMDCGGNFFFYI